MNCRDTIFVRSLEPPFVPYVCRATLLRVCRGYPMFLGSKADVILRPPFHRQVGQTWSADIPKSPPDTEIRRRPAVCTYWSFPVLRIFNILPPKQKSGSVCEPTRLPRGKTRGLLPPKVPFSKMTGFIPGIDAFLLSVPHHDTHGRFSLVNLTPIARYDLTLW